MTGLLLKEGERERGEGGGGREGNRIPTQEGGMWGAGPGSFLPTWGRAQAH